MARIAPTTGNAYTCVGMEYATTGAFTTATGLACNTHAGTSAITFDTSQHVHGAKSMKLVLNGNGAFDPYAFISKTVSGTPEWYEVAGWFMLDASYPGGVQRTDPADALTAQDSPGLILMRLGPAGAGIGIRPYVDYMRRATNAFQLMTLHNYAGDHFGRAQAIAKTNGSIPVLVPNQWHYIKIRASGYGTGAHAITFAATIDGIEVNWATADTKPRMTGVPTALELGCVKAWWTALPNGKTITLWMDDIRMASGPTAIPDCVSPTTITPIYSGNDTATLVIASNVPSNATVNYGATSGVYDSTWESTSASTWHKCAIPWANDASCNYQVTLENAAEASDVITVPERSFRTRRTLSPADQFDIGVICDMQEQATRAHVAHYLGRRHPDLVLCPGDVTAIQDVGRTAWNALTEQEQEQVLATNTTLLYQPTERAMCIPTVGNHDYVGSCSDLPASSDWFRDKMGMPGNSVCDFGCVRIITLEDLGAWVTAPVPDETLDWLADALRESPATWNIVQTHFPLYYVPNDAWAPYDNRAKIAAVLEEHGCNIMLSAHRHSYNRYMCNGVLYLITSTASSYQVPDYADWSDHPVLNTKDGTRSPHAGSRRYSIYRGGYTTMDVTPTRIWIRFWRRDDDTCLDSYRLLQRRGGPR